MLYNLWAEAKQFRLDGPLALPAFPRRETDVDGREWDVIDCESVRSVPLRLSLLAGDAIHNARSALDHLVYQLVLADDGDPSPRTAFPIHVKEPDERAARKYDAAVEGITREEPLTLIRAFQPYKRPASPLREDIALLGRLDIQDKHRTIPPGVIVLTKAATTVADAILSPGPVREGQEMSRQRASASGQKIQFAIRHEFGFFEECVDIERLERVLKHAEEVVLNLGRFLL